MLAPPNKDDWTSRVDPTKLKSRAFNTAKGAKAQSRPSPTTGPDVWNETPEQKRKRLEDQVMGVNRAEPSSRQSPAVDESARNPDAEETRSRLKEYNVS